ncbi:MAG: hypothetical protein R3F59_18205 [Myxococcota bacterium]
MIWWMGACGLLAERQQRVWEMEDHVADVLAARDALRAGDLAAAQAAGQGLMREDPVPGLPDAAQPFLAAVRDGGRALAREHDPEAAAATLMAITGDCAGCHRALAVPVPRSLVGSPEEDAWLGLVFESEARWREGASAVALPEGASWAERRAAYAAWLVPTPGAG